MEADGSGGTGRYAGDEKAREEARQAREKLSHRMGQYMLKGYRMLGVNCKDCNNILLQKRDGPTYCVYCQEVVKSSAPSSTSGQGTVPSAVVSISTAHSEPSPSIIPPNSPKVTKSGSISGEHSVPVACSGKTSDTVKLTMTPASHVTVMVSTDTKQTGLRTNPGVLQSTGKCRAPPEEPSDRAPPHSERTKEPFKTRAASVEFGADHTQLAPTSTSAAQEAGLECQAVLLSKLKWCSGELETSQSLENSIALCRLISSIGEAMKSLREAMPLSLSEGAGRSTDDSDKAFL